jgi:ADP-ribosylglycohydrolase
MINRYRGSLLGLAAGDALGTTLEFKPPGSFTRLEDMVGGGPFRLAPGQWTDDTSMALCLAESLVTQQGFDPADQMARYLRWYREGYLSSTGRCFDIGNTVREALERFERTQEPYSGSTDPRSAGNGSIMRLAPVPLFYSPNPSEAIVKSGESSRATHGATAAVDACRYLGALLVGAVNGDRKEALLSDYVVKSLEAALWAFYHTRSFKAGCLLAVNLGDDADTTGAVYGQLAGAFYGEGAIPGSWRSKLTQRHLIESLAERLFVLSRP